MNPKILRRSSPPGHGTFADLILLLTLGMGLSPVALCFRFDCTTSQPPSSFSHLFPHGGRASKFTQLTLASLALGRGDGGEEDTARLESNLRNATPVKTPAGRLDSPSNPSPLGTIRGTVRIENKIQPRSIAFSLYSRRGKFPVDNKPHAPVNELQNVVLYLEGRFQTLESASSDSLPEENPTIQQVNETFIPHVLPIKVGTTVDFPNGDPFFHNVFSLSSARSFDLGRYPKHQVRSIRFERPGIIKVFCHIHSHMSAVILVFDHPYFSVPDSSGGFRLSDIPPGTYNVVAWHERLKPQKKCVAIAPGTDVHVEMIL